MHSASLLRVPATATRASRPQRTRASARLSPERTGIVSRVELLAAGHGDAEIRSLVAAGRIQRAGRGWYALPDAHPAAVRALRGGRRLTCIDACELYGLWIPPGAAGPELHAYRPRESASVPPRVRPHRPALHSWPQSDAVASLNLALTHAMRCQSTENTVILLESAVCQGLLTPDECQMLLDAAPVDFRRRIGTLSTASESGSESRVVRALRGAGFTVEQQVYVQGVGWVDAYVAGLFLEIDGRLHHSSPAAFDEDRRRDLAMRRLGLQVLRLSYHQVWRMWEPTWQALRQTIAQVGRHGRRAAEAAGMGIWPGLGDVC